MLSTFGCMGDKAIDSPYLHGYALCDLSVRSCSKSLCKMPTQEVLLCCLLMWARSTWMDLSHMDKYKELPHSFHFMQLDEFFLSSRHVTVATRKFELSIVLSSHKPTFQNKRSGELHNWPQKLAFRKNWAHNSISKHKYYARRGTNSCDRAANYIKTIVNVNTLTRVGPSDVKFNMVCQALSGIWACSLKYKSTVAQRGQHYK